MKAKVIPNPHKIKRNKQKRIFKNYKIQTLFLDFLPKFKNFFKLQFSGLFHHVIIVNGHQLSLSQVLSFLHSFLLWVKIVKIFLIKVEAAFMSDLLGIPLIVYICIPAIIFLIHTTICWKKGWKPIESAFYTIYSFLLTIAWLTLVVGVLINLL